MSEWPNEHAWKACLPAKVTRVRIPLSPLRMKKILIVFCLQTLSLCALGQRFQNFDYKRWNFVGGIGASTYFGELNTGASFSSVPALSVGVQYDINERWSARLEGYYFTLSASDADTGNPGKIQRNLSFKSTNAELSGSFMYNLFTNHKSYSNRPGFNIYSFLGLGICYYNPTTTLNGVTYSLRQYQTEGVSYSSITPVIPLGLGLRIKLTKDFNIDLESGLRLAFTDRLDDVSDKYPTIADPNSIQAQLSYAFLRAPNNTSTIADKAGTQRGNPKTNDFYYFFSVKVEYRLPINYSHLAYKKGIYHR